MIKAARNDNTMRQIAGRVLRATTRMTHVLYTFFSIVSFQRRSSRRRDRAARRARKVFLPLGDYLNCLWNEGIESPIFRSCFLAQNLCDNVNRLKKKKKKKKKRERERERERERLCFTLTCVSHEPVSCSRGVDALSRARS